MPEEDVIHEARRRIHIKHGSGALLGGRGGGHTGVKVTVLWDTAEGSTVDVSEFLTAPTIMAISAQSSLPQRLAS
jgi:hypothetical protein